MSVYVDQLIDTSHPNTRKKGPIMSQDDPTIFDRLVEQQDQELARDGEVSLATQLHLHAFVEGKPVPHVCDSPAIQNLTARLLQRLSLPPEEDEVDYGDWSWLFDDDRE